MLNLRRRRSSYDWQAIHADLVQILDPDGWDRRNLDADMLRPISERAWWAKTQNSTCRFTRLWVEQNDQRLAEYRQRGRRPSTGILGTLKSILVEAAE